MRTKLLLIVIALVVVAVIFAGIGVVALPTARALIQAQDRPTQRLASALRTPATAVPSAASTGSAVASAAAVAPAPTTQANSAGIVVPQADTSPSQLLEAIYAKVNPSVVQVTNLTTTARRSTNAIPQGEGSGFVWDVQGDIVTNDHVVSGATKLQVTFADGTTVDATLVGSDPDSDIAVLKVDPNATTLIPVAQGDITQVKVGELAIAIGNPFGFQGTMTTGIVSAIGRTIPSQTSFSIPEAVQTDAAINPGNSGGPLLNSRGQVIGVNDQIETGSNVATSSGIGFAVPINIVQRVVPSLIQNGSYQHAYLGISGGTYSRAWSQALGLPVNAKGAYVLDVLAGGPAAQAGLHAGSRDTNVLLGTDTSGAPTYLQAGGDLITAIDDHPVTKMDDLLVYLEGETSPGQTVQLTILRDGGQQQTIRVKLSARPSQSGG